MTTPNTPDQPDAPEHDDAYPRITPFDENDAHTQFPENWGSEATERDQAAIDAAASAEDAADDAEADAGDAVSQFNDDEGDDPTADKRPADAGADGDAADAEGDA